MGKMTPDARAKRIDKARKCLRLSKSSEPNEAAAALRQAQAIMRELGVDEDDLEAEEIVGEVIKTKEAFGGCFYLAALRDLVCHAFGVVSVCEPGNGISRVRANIRYVGPRARASLAVYTHRVVDRAINAAWGRVRHMFDQRPGARQTFRLSFLAEIHGKVQAIVPTDAEGRRVEKWLTTRFGPSGLVTVEVAGRATDPEAALLGMVEAAGFNLHCPVEEQRLGIGSEQ